MSYEVKKLTAEEWSTMSQDAHMATFGEYRPAALERHHFALLALYEGRLGGYVTCLEMDSNTVYIQLGGVFPGFEKTVHTAVGYSLMIKRLADSYKEVWARIENINTPMLKMAMKVGFIIQGVWMHNGKVLVEHCLKGSEVTNG